MNAPDLEAACTAIAVGLRTLRERLDAGDDDVATLTSTVAEIDAHIASLPAAPTCDAGLAGRCAALLRAAENDRRCCLDQLTQLRAHAAQDAATVTRGENASRAYRAVVADDARFVDRQQ